MDTVITSNENSFVKLQKIIELHVNIAVENADGLAALNSDWMHLEGKLDYYLNLRQTYEANFKSIVEKGILKNEIKPVNSEVLMFSMLSTLRSLYLWIPKKEIVDSQVLSKDLCQILLTGINK